MLNEYRYFPAVAESPEALADRINGLLKDGYSVLHISGPVYNPHNGEWFQALWVWAPKGEDKERDDYEAFKTVLREIDVPDEFELADMMQS